MSEAELLDMARSLVCIMSTDEVIAILEGEGYEPKEIEEFIDNCNS